MSSLETIEKGNVRWKKKKQFNKNDLASCKITKSVNIKYTTTTTTACDRKAITATTETFESP